MLIFPIIFKSVVFPLPEAPEITIKLSGFKKQKKYLKRYLYCYKQMKDY